MMSASEQIRKRGYLTQFGIEEWYVRKPLRGAAPSRSLYLDSEEALRFKNEDVPIPNTVTSITVTRTRQPVPGAAKEASSPSRGLALDMLSALNGRESETSDKKSDVEPAPQIVKDLIPVVESAPTFTNSQSVIIDSPLNWLVVMTDTLFLLSDVDSEPFLSGVEMFSRNIIDAMSAVNPSVSVANFSVQHFAWPIFSNDQVPGNDMTAMIALFKRQYEEIIKEKTLQVFALGENASRFADTGIALSTQNGCFKSNISLRDMLDDPSLKANFWHSVLESSILQI
jgi:hypothetical protein